MPYMHGFHSSVGLSVRLLTSRSGVRASLGAYYIETKAVHVQQHRAYAVCARIIPKCPHLVSASDAEATAIPLRAQSFFEHDNIC